MRTVIRLWFLLSAFAVGAQDSALVDTNGVLVHPTNFLSANGIAPLASPALSGNPTAPTATAGDNDTSISTTAFVTAAIEALKALQLWQDTNAVLTTLAALTGGNSSNFFKGTGAFAQVTTNDIPNLVTMLEGLQPLDADLTSIAVMTWADTNTFLRGDKTLSRDGQNWTNLTATQLLLGAVPTNVLPGALGTLSTRNGGGLTNITEAPPAWENGFDANSTGIIAANSGNITLDTNNSRLTIGNGIGSGRGASLNSFTLSSNVTYLITLHVDQAPTARWRLQTKPSGGTTIGTISRSGWYGFTHTASASDDASNLYIYADESADNRQLSLGYASISTNPPIDRILASGIGVQTNVVRRTDSHLSVGFNQRVARSSGSPNAPDGGVNIAPYGMSGSSGVSLGKYAHSSAADGTGFGWTYASGGESVAIGDYAFAGSWRDTAVGDHAFVGPVSSAAYGFYTFTELPHSIAMGRSGSIPSNTGDTDGIFSIEPKDVYFGKGLAHSIPHPLDADNLTLSAADFRGNIPTRVLTIHGPDAYDARVGNYASATPGYYATTNDRNAIAVSSRYPGMIVYCADVNKSFLLDANFDTTATKRVNSYSRSGTTATVNLAEYHGGIVAGDVITLVGISSSWNTNWTVTAAPSNSIIQFTHTSSGTVATTYPTTAWMFKNLLAVNTEKTSGNGNGGWLDLSVAWAKTSLSRWRTNNTAYIRFSTEHNLSRSNTITTTGFSDASFNVADTPILSVTPFSQDAFLLSYTNAGADVASQASPASDTGGTITPHDVRSLNQDAWDMEIVGGRGTGTGASGSIKMRAVSALTSKPNPNTKQTLTDFLVIDGAEDTNEATGLKLQWNGSTYRVAVTNISGDLYLILR